MCVRQCADCTLDSNDLRRPTVDEWDGYEPRWNDATHEASKATMGETGRGDERFEGLDDDVERGRIIRGRICNVV